MIINTVGLRCKRFERESRLTKAASQISGVGTIGHLSTTKIESKPHTMAASRTGRGETGASEPSLHIRTTGARAEATPTAVLGRLGGALMGLPRGQEPQRTPPPRTGSTRAAAALCGLHSVTQGQSLSCSARVGTAEGPNCTQLGGDGRAWPRAEMMLDRGEPSCALRQTSSFPRLQAEISKEEERKPTVV